MAISYAQASIPVRSDIQDAHNAIWQKLAEPGTWWTGAERVAIAAEVRRAYDCQFCQVRKAALSPSAVEGKHDTDGVLPEVVVEMIHRVTIDNGRLSREWCEQLLAQGLQATHYVEALGVLVRTISIDTFCRAIDVPLHALPSPEDGAPSQYRPSLARQDGEWVPMFPAGELSGPDVDLYPGRTASPVLRALSLVPDEVRLSILTLLPAQYMDPFQVRDPHADPGRAINRPQIELLAARVSSLNQCFY